MSYPSAYLSYPSYRSPVPSSNANPREKYLAALAEAKAAEAEYLAAEKLQQEEDALRTRLEQIQQLKYHPAPAAYAPGVQYNQAVPQYHQPATQYPHAAPAPLDLDALRRQIAAEERARIIREQAQARELEARKLQQARELEARRFHEARKADRAREKERSRALVAQRSDLTALTQQALSPAVRFIVAEEPNRREHHCRPHHSARQEPRNTRCAPKEVQEDTISLQDLLGQLFGHDIQQSKVTKTQVPALAPVAPQAISLEELIRHVLGDGAAAPHAKPQAEAKVTPQAAPVTLEQLFGHFLGAAGVAQPAAPMSGSPSASTSKSTLRQNSVKQTAPAPSPSAPAAPPAMKPAVPAPTPAAPAGMNHTHFLGGAAAQPSAPNQVDIQQLMNMFLGGSAQAPNAPNACSKSETNKCGLSRREDLAAREERELAEAIRLSLSESHAAPASPTESTKNRGKAPAPAPVPDVASSTAEVHAIDAAFSALAGGFAFPAQLDFSTSRAASPTRTGATTPTSEESAVAKLSYSALNQPVRVYHQALSGLLGRLDAVDSLGDEGLRNARKDVVGRVEGALDEVIEARWRKFVGREVRVGTEPAPVSAGDASAPSAAEELAVQPHPETAVPEPSPSPAGESESHPLSASIAAPSAPIETPPAPVDINVTKESKPRKSEAESDWAEVDA
ncbi:hypothetical protein DFH06DRAFT_1335523 [Mycena polygramma]|nr:hypothetical protein DFH06DRAFT_1335523 [Mycena polygramma]